MSEIKIKKPKIVDEVFSKSDFNYLKNTLRKYPKKEMGFNKRFGRYGLSDRQSPLLLQYAKNLTPFARQIFKSKTLVPSFTLFAHYEGQHASLSKHIDDNACTYSLDLCLYQKVPWEIYVEGKPYLLSGNQALCFYGNNQEHWREAFPSPKTNQVGMVFFHFVEPNHWYYAKGPDYIDEIRKKK